MAEGDRRPVRETGPGPMGPTRLDLTKPVIAAIEGHAVAGGWSSLCGATSASPRPTLSWASTAAGSGCRSSTAGRSDCARLIGQSHALDLLLTGRGVGGPEALAMGLVNRLVPHGRALKVAAVALATEIAAFPQVCMRNDRRSMLDQWSLSEHEALANEARLGRSTIASGEAAIGAQRFTSGEGRHGSTTSNTDSS